MDLYSCRELKARQLRDKVVRVLFQRCGMLCSCGYVWLPPIIFIGIHSLVLVERVQIRNNFYMKRYVLWMRVIDVYYGCVLWMCAMDACNAYVLWMVSKLSIHHILKLRLLKLLCGGTSSWHILLVPQHSLVSVETVTKFHWKQSLLHHRSIYT
ncbi:hypothetical protein SFRURICE_013882 [Spodoptera frugiperda]|nr:hypothetical protein SFRURICE_013882 [Spodoptera frugiperda]